MCTWRHTGELEGQLQPSRKAHTNALNLPRVSALDAAQKKHQQLWDLKGSYRIYGSHLAIDHLTKFHPGIPESPWLSNWLIVGHASILSGYPLNEIFSHALLEWDGPQLKQMGWQHLRPAHASVLPWDLRSIRSPDELPSDQMIIKSFQMLTIVHIKSHGCLQFQKPSLPHIWSSTLCT